MNRIYTIDMIKGLAMLVVFQWHIVGNHSRFTEGWTMPIFFIIMGLFYKQDKSYVRLLKKKVNTLLVPALFGSIPALLALIVELDSSFLDIIKKVGNPYCCVNGVSWFLICMFWCYLFYFIINKHIENPVLRLTFCLSISLLFYSLCQIRVFNHRFILPLYMSTSLVSLCFIEIGKWFQYFILPRTEFGGIAKIKRGIYLLFFTTLFLLDVYILNPKPFNMVAGSYSENYIAFFINAIIGSLFLFVMSEYVPKFICKAFAFIGKYSLLLLIYHMYIFKYIVSPLGLYSIFSLLLTIMLALPFCYVIDKYMPIITGRKALFNIK